MRFRKKLSVVGLTLSVLVLLAYGGMSRLNMSWHTGGKLGKLGTATSFRKGTGGNWNGSPQFRATGGRRGVSLPSFPSVCPS